MSSDPYDALGLKKSASAEEIKKAYKKIVRTSHPDLNPGDAGAEAKFKAASAAHDILKDPETRARFERGEIDTNGAERPERQFYRDFAQGGGAQGRGGCSGFGFGGARGGFYGDGDLADFFSDFLRQRGGTDRRGGFAAKGQDLRYTLDVAFLDAARGAKVPITLPDGNRLEVGIPAGA